MFSQRIRYLLKPVKDRDNYIKAMHNDIRMNGGAEIGEHVQSPTNRGKCIVSNKQGDMYSLQQIGGNVQSPTNRGTCIISNKYMQENMYILNYVYNVGMYYYVYTYHAKKLSEIEEHVQSLTCLICQHVQIHHTK